MAEVAADPDAYALAWKQFHPGRKVAGVLPMNFPEELLHAAGFLPVVIQENSEPDSEGRVIARRLPFNRVGDDVGASGVRCPSFHRAGTQVHDPIIRHAEPLIERSEGAGRNP